MEIRDIVISEKYISKSGEEKRLYIRIGTLFIRQENGELKISGKLSAAPIGDGSFAAFPKKEYQPRQQEKNNFQSSATLNRDEPSEELNIEDVPF